MLLCLMFTKQRITAYSIVIALAVTFVTFIAASSLSQHSAAAQQSGGAKVSIVSGASTMADKAFSPNPIKVKVGGTVTWTNDDTMFHTVTSGTGISDANKGKEFDSGLSGSTALTTKGKTFDHTFKTAGDFPYFCQLHPTMVGKVDVS